MDFDDFKSEYQDLVGYVVNASHKTIEQRLQDWLTFLESSPISAPNIKEFESLSDFSAWYEDAKRSVGSMVGSGRLKLDSDRTRRLGQYLWLFRHFSNKEGEILEFSLDFAYAKNFDDAVIKVTNEYFIPFSTDLLRHLERSSTKAPETKSNREDTIVHLNHESESYKSLMDQIDKLNFALSQSNELGALHGDEAERTVAEIHSGARLLQAKTVRTDVLKKLFVPALSWLANNFAAGLIGVLATALLAALASLFGFHIPGI